MKILGNIVAEEIKINGDVIKTENQGRISTVSNSHCSRD